MLMLRTHIYSSLTYLHMFVLAFLFLYRHVHTVWMFEILYKRGYFLNDI
uniref:Uncharacterized protein n=1 Tax=Anguilla anguilla TaxID=7936 RepID=A0A0E9WZ60_ANGAN